MAFDIVAAIFVLLAGIVGTGHGFVGGLARTGILGVAWLIGKALARPLGHALSGALGTNASVAGGVAGFFVTAALVVAVALAFRQAMWRLRGDVDLQSGLDRIMGFALGAVRGFAWVWLAAGMWMAAQGLVARKVPSLWFDVYSSHLGRWVQVHQPYRSVDFPWAHALTALAVAAEKGSEALAPPAAADAAARLLHSPVGHALASPAIVRLVRACDWDALFENKALRALLAEPATHRDLDVLETTAGIEPCAM